MTKIAREALWVSVGFIVFAANMFGLHLVHQGWEAVILSFGGSVCVHVTANHGMRLASAWRYRTLPAVYAEPTPDELRAPFMAVALAEVDDMKLGGPRLVAPRELPGPSLGAQMAGGWMSTGAGLANALPPAREWPAEPEWRSDAWRATAELANQREPEASPSYPPGREPESVALQGQILSGWRESYAKRTRYRL
jgi:hypothetical protein